jgi:hypothetical protein
MTALAVCRVEAGTCCAWCDRAAEAGAVWIADAAAWRYCSPICYARTVDATAVAEAALTDGDAHGRARFTDALTHVMRALSMLLAQGT